MAREALQSNNWDNGIDKIDFSQRGAKGFTAFAYSAMGKDVCSIEFHVSLARGKAPLVELALYPAMLDRLCNIHLLKTP